MRKNLAGEFFAAYVERVNSAVTRVEALRARLGTARAPDIRHVVLHVEQAPAARVAHTPFGAALDPPQ